MRQIFLIGLRFYTTGEWPYFGPDVVYTETQLPGALQGVLVGGPLFLVPRARGVLPAVEPAVVRRPGPARLVHRAAVSGRCQPGFSGRGSLFAPWTLGFSTEINNPSYVLTGAVLFFVGVFEIVAAAAAWVRSRTALAGADGGVRSAVGLPAAPVVRAARRPFSRSRSCCLAFATVVRRSRPPAGARSARWSPGSR